MSHYTLIKKRVYYYVSGPGIRRLRFDSENSARQIMDALEKAFEAGKNFG